MSKDKIHTAAILEFGASSISDSQGILLDPDDPFFSLAGKIS